MLVPLPGSTLDLQSTISSAAPVVLSLLAAVVGVLAFRFAVVWLFKSVFERPSASKAVDQEDQATKPTRYWEMFTLDSLPVSLVPPQTGVLGRGVGVSASGMPLQRQATSAQNWQPAFKGRGFAASRPPSPKAPAPISMAKMIMSRHTYRRPSPPPSRRPTTLPPSPVRQQSIV